LPSRSQRPCSVPGCTNLCANRWCEIHEKDKTVTRKYDLYRGSSTERGYGGEWRKVRLQILKRDNFLCVACLATGRPTTATDVDHIVPMARGGARLDPNNLQSLCSVCHKRKTYEHDGAFGNDVSEI
jgi:5-methylcytosine-specific restriction protein A